MSHQTAGAASGLSPKQHCLGWGLLPLLLLLLLLPLLMCEGQTHLCLLPLLA
jgi:hypothetical protein